MEEIFKIIIAIVSSATSWFAGIIDTPEAILFAFILLDYATSIISHYVSGTLSSSKGFKGFLKKFLVIIISLSSILLDHMMKAEGWISNTVVFYLVANEGLSILENVERGGILVPNFLKDKFKSIHEEEGKNK